MDFCSRPAAFGDAPNPALCFGRPPFFFAAGSSAGAAAFRLRIRAGGGWDEGGLVVFDDRKVVFWSKYRYLVGSGIWRFFRALVRRFPKVPSR